MEKKVTTHVTKGLVIALIFIVLDLVLFFAGLKLESWVGWVTALLTIGAYIWACISYANEMNNAVTFGNVFAHGFKTSAVVACIFFLYTLLFLYVIAPEFIDQVMQKQIEEAEKAGSMQEINEDAMALGKKIGKIMALVVSIIGTLFIGVIGSLIGAAIAKKNPPTPFSTQQPS